MDVIDPQLYSGSAVAVGSVWYSWTADFTGAALFYVYNTDIITQLDVYSDVDGTPIDASSLGSNVNCSLPLPVSVAGKHGTVALLHVPVQRVAASVLALAAGVGHPSGGTWVRSCR